MSIKIVTAGTVITILATEGRALLLNGRSFTLGSAAAEFAQYGDMRDECDTAEEFIAASERRGEDIHWAITNALCIHSGESITGQSIEVEIGQVINFDGIEYRVEQANGVNLELVKFDARDEANGSH